MSRRLQYCFVLTAIAACLFFLEWAPQIIPQISYNSGKQKTVKGSLRVKSKSTHSYTWGIIDHLSQKKNAVSAYRQIINHISEKSGIKLKIKTASNYHNLEASLLSGEFQIANLSALAYTRLKHESSFQLKPLASELYKGSRYYLGYIFTHTRTGFQKLADLKNRRFAFVSRASASGFLFPSVYLHSKGIDPEKYFSKVFFAGSHQKVLEAVRKGIADGGATFDASFHYIARQPEQYRIIGKTEKIPSGVISASDQVTEADRELLKAVLFQLTSSTEPSMKKFRKDSQISGWAPFQNADYIIVKKALRLKNAD